MAKHTSPGLSFLYHTAAGRFLLKGLTAPPVSRLVGRYLDSRLSRIHIAGFVRRNGIDLAGCEKQSFSSFNDCFTRTLRPDQRPVNMDPNALISPCDGLLSVFPIEPDRVFAVKGSRYTLSELLGGSEIAGQYGGGLCLIFRLCVGDYHRYCYVSDGYRSSGRRIEGVLHTVNPVANDCYPIYKMNTREYCLLKTRKLGTVLTMEVGALMVGKIRNYKKERCQVKRGEEKGRFEFGGSTVVLLLEPDKVLPDSDLIRNTLQGAETIVKMGERIGGVVCLEKNSSI